MRSNGRPARSYLGDVWPTPTVCGNYNRKGASKTSGDGLATAVATSLTTICSDATDAPPAKAQTFPTPTVNDAKNSTLPPSQIKHDNLPGHLLRSGEKAGGSLNPTWVEWLMGWPLGWTDLKPLETDKCRDVRLKRGAC
jgi:hypothetical protein